MNGRKKRDGRERRTGMRRRRYGKKWKGGTKWQCMIGGMGGGWLGRRGRMGINGSEGTDERKGRDGRKRSDRKKSMDGELGRKWRKEKERRMMRKGGYLVLEWSVRPALFQSRFGTLQKLCWPAIRKGGVDQSACAE